jgi:gamma-polyglutamate synthase
MVILTILTIFIFSMGFLENYYHLKSIKKIPIRIHVNGTRGKSTTVRLIAASLREAGYCVLAKTTGTTPRIILENGAEETIKRRGAANIIEQKRFIQKAVQRGNNAVVLECMAVHPETQWVSEHQLIKSTIGVITNVREDHQDVYGPDLRDGAEALKLTIPQNGYLVTAEKRFFPLFQQEAEKLNTRCILVNPEKAATKKLVQESENFYFKDNVAITIQVGQLLGINKETILRGISKANPDPGALTIYLLKNINKFIWFINAFAANDRESMLIIWQKINQLLPGKMDDSPKIALINHRDDRITRTIQFDKMLSRDLNFNHIMLAGPTSQLSRRKLIKLGYPSDQINLIKKRETAPQVIEKIFQLIEKVGIVYGLGNTRGFGLEIVEYLKENGEKI